jgi:hypothetical protein
VPFCKECADRRGRWEKLDLALLLIAVIASFALSAWFAVDGVKSVQRRRNPGGRNALYTTNVGAGTVILGDSGIWNKYPEVA